MDDLTHANLFYFRIIMPIGGTEQFLFEIAKKYHKYDITILYDECAIEQLIRLRKFVRCIKRDPYKTYRAKKAFYNFNTDAINQIEADEHVFVSHAIYQELGYVPPVDHPKLTRWVGVSEYSRDHIQGSLDQLGVDGTAETYYNPLTLEAPKPVIKIISAARLDDKVKGGERTLKLIDALDRQSVALGIPYQWHIYSNASNVIHPSENVFFCKGRIDIRNFIADADWLVQLSNDMESYCYSINEAWGYGTGVVRTPLTVCKEFNPPRGLDLVCDWDMKNADKIAEKMLKTPQKARGCRCNLHLLLSSYDPPTDGWDELLDHTKSTYNPKFRPYLTVRAKVRYFDIKLRREIDPYSGEIAMDEARVVELAKKDLIEIMA